MGSGKSTDEQQKSSPRPQRKDLRSDDQARKEDSKADDRAKANSNQTTPLPAGNSSKENKHRQQETDGGLGSAEAGEQDSQEQLQEVRDAEAVVDDALQRFLNEGER